MGELFTLGTYVCSHFVNYGNSQNFGAILSVENYFSQKIGWDKFWAVFSQTHLVTLVKIHNKLLHLGKYWIISYFSMT
jgi:hypothetical protein